MEGSGGKNIDWQHPDRVLCIDTFLHTTSFGRGAVQNRAAKFIGLINHEALIITSQLKQMNEQHQHRRLLNRTKDPPRTALQIYIGKVLSFQQMFDNPQPYFSITGRYKLFFHSENTSISNFNTSTSDWSERVWWILQKNYFDFCLNLSSSNNL